MVCSVPGPLQILTETLISQYYWHYIAFLNLCLRTKIDLYTNTHIHHITLHHTKPVFYLPVSQLQSDIVY